jgi:hypothetical protein
MSQRIEIYDATLRDGAQGEGVNPSFAESVLLLSVVTKTVCRKTALVP